MRRLVGIVLTILAACSAAAAIADAPGWTVSRLEKDAPPEAARDVTGGSLDSAFHNVAAERIARRGWSMWLRVRIETAREAPEPVVLVLRHARTARATLFPPSGKPVSQSLYGDDPHPRFTQDALYFPLGNSLKAGDSYYILVEQLRAGSVAVDLRDMAEVNAANLAHTRTVALTIGAMLVLGLTQLLLFAWLPERAMLYLGASATLGSVYSALLLGDGYAWLPFASETLVTFNILQVAGSLAVGCDILFFRELLDFGRYERRIRALLKAIAIFYFAEGAMLVAAGGEMLRLLTLLANLGTLLVWVLIVPGMIVGSIRGGNVARLLLGAWALTTLITIPRILSYVRGDPETAFLYYGFPIALTIGFVLKSCALAERVRLQRGGRKFVAGNAPEDDEYEGVLQRLRMACEHAAAAGPTTVIKVQIDGAKRIAAAHGEAVVRACVAKVRQRIRNALRDDDTLGAIGAGEFLVVMPGANAQAAAAAAERIRRRVSESAVHSDGVSLDLTASVGLAWTQTVVEVDSLMAQADAAAATADHAGGNQVVELPA